MHITVFSRFSIEDGKDIYKSIRNNLRIDVLKDSVRHSYSGDFHKYEFFIDYREDGEIIRQLGFLSSYRHIVRIILNPCTSFNFNDGG